VRKNLKPWLQVGFPSHSVLEIPVLTKFWISKDRSLEVFAGEPGTLFALYPNVGSELHEKSHAYPNVESGPFCMGFLLQTDDSLG
jgi:hypothetical protein